MGLDGERGYGAGSCRVRVCLFTSLSPRALSAPRLAWRFWGLAPNKQTEAGSVRVSCRVVSMSSSKRTSNLTSVELGRVDLVWVGVIVWGAPSYAFRVYG